MNVDRQRLETMAQVKAASPADEKDPVGIAMKDGEVDQVIYTRWIFKYDELKPAWDRLHAEGHSPSESIRGAAFEFMYISKGPEFSGPEFSAPGYSGPDRLTMDEVGDVMDATGKFLDVLGHRMAEEAAGKAEMN
jgi:hypothetical protein